MELFKRFKKKPVEQVVEPVQVLPERTTTPKIPKIKKPRKPKVKKPVQELSAKEKATQAGEPYINILSMDIDPNDINSGAFELDWNNKFILNLVRAGYKYKDSDTDIDLVNRWFSQICRNIALEVYEQVVADPLNREVRPVQKRDLGNGRTEVS
jgi:hypothetical protein